MVVCEVFLILTAFGYVSGNLISSADSGTTCQSSVPSGTSSPCTDAIDGQLGGFDSEKWHFQGDPMGAWIYLAFRETKVVKYIQIKQAPAYTIETVDLIFGVGLVRQLQLQPDDSWAGIGFSSTIITRNVNISVSSAYSRSASQNNGLLEIQVFNSVPSTTPTPIDSATTPAPARTSRLNIVTNPPTTVKPIVSTVRRSVAPSIVPWLSTYKAPTTTKPTTPTTPTTTTTTTTPAPTTTPKPTTTTPRPTTTTPKPTTTTPKPTTTTPRPTTTTPKPTTTTPKPTTTTLIPTTTTTTRPPTTTTTPRPTTTTTTPRPTTTTTTTQPPTTTTTTTPRPTTTTTKPTTTTPKPTTTTPRPTTTTTTRRQTTTTPRPTTTTTTQPPTTQRATTTTPRPTTTTPRPTTTTPRPTTTTPTPSTTTPTPSTTTPTPSTTTPTPSTTTPTPSTTTPTPSTTTPKPTTTTPRPSTTLRSTTAHKTTTTTKRPSTTERTTTPGTSTSHHFSSSTPRPSSTAATTRHRSSTTTTSEPSTTMRATNPGASTTKTAQTTADKRLSNITGVSKGASGLPTPLPTFPPDPSGDNEPVSGAPRETVPLVVIAAVAGAVGTLALVTIVVCCIICCRRKQKRTEKPPPPGLQELSKMKANGINPYPNSTVTSRKTVDGEELYDVIDPDHFVRPESQTSTGQRYVDMPNRDSAIGSRPSTMSEYDFEEDPYEFPENEYVDPAMMGHMYQNRPHTYSNVHSYLRGDEEPDYENTLNKNTATVVPPPNNPKST